MKDQHTVQNYLLSLLLDLDGVQQDSRFHPEGDALFHSLQVFQIALQQSDNPNLLAAALFHDVGKVNGSKDHDKEGAEMLSGVLNSDITWLVEHHLDLLIHPAKTKKHLRNRKHQLVHLQQLRKWDVLGRDPYAEVMPPEQAISIIGRYQTAIAP